MSILSIKSQKTVKTKLRVKKRTQTDDNGRIFVCLFMYFCASAVIYLSVLLLKHLELLLHKIKSEFKMI